MKFETQLETSQKNTREVSQRSLFGEIIDSMSINAEKTKEACKLIRGSWLLREYATGQMEYEPGQEDINKTIRAALLENGGLQRVIAIEEYSEIIIELCKDILGEGNQEHIAEELADAQIVTQEMTQLYGVGDLVSANTSLKLARLQNRLDKEVTA